MPKYIEVADDNASVQNPQRLKEHRELARVSVNEEFEPIADEIAGYVDNLSQGGVFIRSDEPLSVGTKVVLNFSIILDDIETIQGEGEVVRVDMSEDNKGMGIAFTKLTSESKAVIDEICRRAGVL
jgi:uncharacterized protein (TIGR02266 family)